MDWESGNWWQSHFFARVMARGFAPAATVIGMRAGDYRWQGKRWRPSSLARTSRNQKGGSWPLTDEARGSGNRLLTRAALILAIAFPATFDTIFMMQVLTVTVRMGSGEPNQRH